MNFRNNMLSRFITHMDLLELMNQQSIVNKLSTNIQNKENFKEFIMYSRQSKWTSYSHPQVL